MVGCLCPTCFVGYYCACGLDLLACVDLSFSGCCCYCGVFLFGLFILLCYGYFGVFWCCCFVVLFGFGGFVVLVCLRFTRSCCYVSVVVVLSVWLLALVCVLILFGYLGV